MRWYGREMGGETWEGIGKDEGMNWRASFQDED